MSSALTELLELLKLETIEQGIYRGQSQDLGLRQVYGGQVVGQALAAAKQTVPVERSVHSFHSYFLRPGDASKAIVYEVEQLRDGSSFSARRVSALQDGQVIFYLTASFQLEQPGHSHQDPMPEVPPPESLLSDVAIAKQHAALIPASLRAFLTHEKPIEMRPANFYNPLAPTPSAGKRYTWLKANGKLPDSLRSHTNLLAYASDFNFLPTAGQPHGISLLQPNIRMATIDHSMWFHRPFRLDEWLLYAVDSPTASNSRGFVRGQFFNREGQLIASTSQEGLMRDTLLQTADD